MKHMRTYLAATLAMVAASCSDSGSGRVTLLLKDAPAPDVRAAVVTIAQVSLVGDGGAVVLRDTPVTTNLLTLANDVMTLVDAAAVPAGTYTQLRFVITGGYLDVAGTIYASSPTYEGLPPDAVVGGALQMPSYGRSGLKVILPGDGLVIGDPAQTWVVDFDVSQSFGHDTGTDKWVMHPVIKATALADTGAVAVTLSPGDEIFLPPSAPLSLFQATLTPVGGGETKSILLTDRGDGVFGTTFVLLPAGDYDVSFVPPATLTNVTTIPPVPARVTVTGGATTQADFSISGFDVVETPPL